MELSYLNTMFILLHFSDRHFKFFSFYFVVYQNFLDDKNGIKLVKFIAISTDCTDSTDCFLGISEKNEGNKTY